MNVALVGSRPTASVLTSPSGHRRHSPSELEEVVRTLIESAGNDSDREGLMGAPGREGRANGKLLAGVHEDLVALLGMTFGETAACDGMTVLRDIRLESGCKHHIVPVQVGAHIGCLPADCVVVAFKLACLVELFVSWVEIQEALTSQITGTIQGMLESLGVFVVIEAASQCMTARGVRRPNVNMVASRALGSLRDHRTARREFLSMIGGQRSTPHVL